MSVFSDLCMRARACGVTRLVFTAELFEQSTPEGICGGWSCIAGRASDEDAMAKADGRTGEEALRNLVANLEYRR